MQHKRHARLFNFYRCEAGPSHWGRLGAAGLLPVTTWRGRLYVLLALRANGTQSPRTWGTLGGAVEPGETPWQAARREASEEVSGLLSGEPVSEHISACPACGWTYTTFVVRAVSDAPGLFPYCRQDSWEIDRLSWASPDQLNTYELHPGLARSWSSLEIPADGRTDGQR